MRRDSATPSLASGSFGGAQRWRKALVLSEEMRLLLFTPETSGGLLAAISPKLDALLALFAEAEHPCSVVGEVAEGAGIEVA